jgi:hypothetical protein
VSDGREEGRGESNLELGSKIRWVREGSLEGKGELHTERAENIRWMRHGREAL